MSQTVKTNKGSVLPLINLKGKAYLQVAHRLQWLADDHERYDVSTELVSVSEEMAVVRASITIMDASNNIVRRATATKKETKKDFPDFIEKAETGALGRALAMVGLGTQHAMADLDEGDRLADSPVTVTNKNSITVQTDSNNSGTLPVTTEGAGVTADAVSTAKKRSSFNPKKNGSTAPTTDGGWT